jgi:hypothetical protein
MELKSYSTFSDDEELNEINFIRGAAALAMASKVRKYGKQVEQNTRAAKTLFDKVSSEDDISRKLDIIATGMMALTEASFNTRKMIGSLTGVALSAALLSERSNKELTKITRGKK